MGELTWNALRYTQDLNSQKRAGIVFVGAESINTPESYSFIVTFKSDKASDILQLALSIIGKHLYLRSYDGNVWSEWKKLI